MDLVDLVDRKHRRPEERDEKKKTLLMPDFRPGDTVDVHLRIIEGDQERIQVFRGTVVQRRGGKGVNASFTVRKVTAGVGIERVLPLHSPRIARVDIIRRGRVRRAKLFYLRDLRGKAARVTEKRDLRTAQQKAEAQG